MKCECFVYVIEWYRFFFRIISLYICIRIDYLKNKKTIKCAFLVIYCLSLFIYCRHEVMYTKYDIMAGSGEVSHNVHNLQPGIEYLFVVTATNQAGEGEMSNSRSAKTFNAGVIWLHVFNTVLLSKTLHSLFAYTCTCITTRYVFQSFWKYILQYLDPSSPRNVRLSDVQPYSLTVSWEIPQTTNGIIQKYQIWYQIVHSNKRK